MVIREPGTPRPRETYRTYRRNNIIEWRGVMEDRSNYHPPLERNSKNQVNFSRKRISEET